MAGPSGPAFLFNFYPRSPCGERRWLRCWQLAARDISIHALLAESDFRQNYECFKWIKFLSTLSLRRATYLDAGKSCNVRHFYPRSPCGERRGMQSAAFRYADFYPRSPCGERLFGVGGARQMAVFLSTLSLRRATLAERRTV